MTPVASNERRRLVVLALVVTIAFGSATVTLAVVVDAPGAGSSVTPTFVERSTELGLEYRTTGANRGNGDGGVLVTDFDRDGWQDVLALGGDPPILFENTDGEFEPSGALPDGVAPTGLQSGLFFDYDNDGWDDLLLLPRASEPVFLENEEGDFRHIDVGLDRPLTWATSATAADYDRDGCLDLFITQNGNWSKTVPQRAKNGSTAHDNGNPNLLYEGTCEEFIRVHDAGIADTRWSLVASSADLNGDDWPDLYVANDFNNDAVYLNRGNGTFVKHDVPGSNRHGMAADVDDVNGDGHPDIFVTNIEYRNPERVWVMQSGLGLRNRGNMLLVNRGNGTFVDRATELGVRAGGWGWSGNLVDLDNDGQRDLVHTTQTYVTTFGDDPTSNEDDYRHVNTYPSVWTRGEEGFERVNASEAGFEPSNGRGLAVLDFDHDGDRDVVVADTSGPFKFYENRANGGNWLAVDLEGQGHVVTGARVYLTVDGEERVGFRTAEVNYFSQNPRTEWFGLDDASTIDRIRIVFPDGTEVTVRNVDANQRVRIGYDGSLQTGSG